MTALPQSPKNSQIRLSGGARSLQIYNALLCFLSPAILIKKWLKYRRYARDYEWDMDRWFIPVTRMPEAASQAGTRIAITALGGPEVAILDKLSRALEEECPDIHITWVLRDGQAREVAQQTFPTREMVAMPFDFAVPVRHFLRKVRPDVLIVVEKFWWPNLIWGCKLAGAQVILVNGRSRGREKSRYKFMGRFQEWILRAFDLMLFESEEQLARVRPILPSEAVAMATGNVKWSFGIPPTPPQNEGLCRWLAERACDENGPLPLIFAGSTAPIDEQWAVEAWQEVKKWHRCALVLAPRRVQRVPEIAAWLEERGLPYSLRSEPHAGCEILILDSMGELAYAYRYARAVYVGGAVGGRGHNIIEPLLWGIPVAYGPNRGDFEAAQQLAEESGVGFRLHSALELAQFWKSALDFAAFQSVADRAEKLLLDQRGALDLTLQSIKATLLSSEV